MKLQFPKSSKDSFLDNFVKQLKNIQIPSFNVAKFTEGFGGFIGKISDRLTMKQAVVLCSAFILILAGIFIGLSGHKTESEDKNHRIRFKVKVGMDASEIARRLEREGIIGSSLKFRILAKLNGYESQLKNGTYSLSPGMEYEEVFAKLIAGEQEFVQVTIPEGFGVKDIAIRLDEEGLVDKEDFIDKAKKFAPYDYIEKHNNVFYYCEGFLFPDTYTFEHDAGVDYILKAMAENLDYRLTDKMRTRAKEENLSIYDLITLASIVEKEVKFSEDRAIVAQVLFKRLKLGMPLQVDATLQYLMDTPKEDVSIADTQIESPYNSYQHIGLPPGPIANPGMAAIEAILNPASTDYLYFVADRSGHNHYANTYEEHLELVNQYR